MKKISPVFEFLLVNMQDGVCVMDEHGLVVYANPAMEKIFCADSSEIVGFKISKSIPFRPRNDELIQVLINAVFCKEENSEAEVYYDNPKGEIRRLRVCMHYTRSEEDSDLNGIVAIFTDVTEIRRIRQTFSRYTSTEISKFILGSEDGEKMGGSLKDSTILMSDIRGFTALSTRLSPMELITELDHYFGEMSSIIESFHGNIIEFLGDGMFVLFNAPNEIKDHPAAAVACAIEMQNAMKKVNEWNREQGFPEFEMGIGINTGDVVVGNIGSTLKTKFGCMGENVNLAGRVESYTIGGQIYVSEFTANRLGSQFVYSGVRSILPKGARKEIQIFDASEISGSYNAKYEKEEFLYNPVKNPETISMHVLLEKVVNLNMEPCQIIGLADNCALINTDAKVEVFDNIMILIDGGNLYAKVIEKRGNGYLVVFTSKPETFGEWYGKIMGEQ